MVSRKQEICNLLIKIALPDIKIIGYPVYIEDIKYPRYRFLFNCCFVVPNVNYNDCLYEPIVRKFAGYLKHLELGESFLSKAESKEKLPILLQQIFDGITQYSRCDVEIDSKVRISLKIDPLPCEPPATPENLVPLIVKEVGAHLHLDVSSQQIVRHIDGFNCIAKISELAAVDVGVVQRIIRNMAFFGVVTLIPLFQYSAQYRVTPEIQEFYDDASVKAECMKFVSLSARNVAMPQAEKALRMYNSLQPGIPLKDW